MQSPSTNLLIPSLKNVPLTLYGNIELYLGFSDFYDAIGYPCEGRSPIDHFSAVIRQRFPDPECRFFNLEVSVEPQKLKVSVSNCDGDMMVFKEPFLADKDLVRHFLNITTHQGISSIFNICDFASMQDLQGSGHFSFGFTVGFVVMLLLQKKYQQQLSVQLYGPFIPFVIGAVAALPYVFLGEASGLAWVNVFFFYALIHENANIITVFGRLHTVVIICGAMYGYILLRYIALVKHCRRYGWKGNYGRRRCNRSGRNNA